MKRLLFLALALVFLPGTLAEALEAEELFPGLEGFISVKPERELYSEGQSAQFTLTLSNPADFPIVGADVIAKVYFSDSRNGQDRWLVEKFAVLEGISLEKGEAIEYGFEWSIPEKSPPGFYSIEPEMRVGKRLKLMDFSGKAEIEVIGSGKADFSFDKVNARINGNRVFPFGGVVDLRERLEVEIETKLFNLGSEKTTVFVKYALYKEEEARGKEEKKEIEAKSYVFKLEPLSAKDFSFSFNLPEQGEYELEIEGRTDNWQDRMEFKILSEGKEAGIVVAGLSEFPLEKGKGFEVFFCFDNYPKEYDMIKQAILIVESNRKEIARLEYEPEKPFERECIKKEFVATEDVAEADVNAVLESFGGEILDEVLIEYSSEKEPRTTPTQKIMVPSREELQGNELTGIAILSGIIIVVLLILFSRKRKH